MQDLEKYLLEAAGKKKQDISINNPYREIGFDGDQPRLGWVEPVCFKQVKSSLESILGLLDGKDTFIFIGMGGSVNGIKPLLSVFGRKNFFTLDSLDPKAIDFIFSRIKKPEKVLVIAISKSGTTKETQLLADSLKNYYIENLGERRWIEHFLWLTDPGSCSKLDSLGWQQAAKISIQADRNSDIGGRFSSPHTLIFLLPLFLLLDKDFERLDKIYSDFIKSQSLIRKKALKTIADLDKRHKFYLSPVIDSSWSESFAFWVIQLFQESLGSKDEQASVKTIINFSDSGFTKLRFASEFKDPVLSIMAHMYYYQVFIAYLAARGNMNFVNQKFVEKYKKEMAILESQNPKTKDIPKGDLDKLVELISQRLDDNHHFIEVVLYFFPSPAVLSFVQEKLSKKFDKKIILIFAGSDWNHQSYQAAFGDKDTFFVLVCLSEYQFSEYVPKNNSSENIETLKRIALATHQTLLDKSILYDLENNQK